MLSFLCAMSLLCIGVTFGYDLACTQKDLDKTLREGFAVLPVNFQKEDAVLLTDLYGVSKRIKLISQKVYPASEPICTIFDPRTPDTQDSKLVKCVELHLEVFGRKHWALAGIYKDATGYPLLFDDGRRSKCGDGNEVQPFGGHLCNREVFTFDAKTRKCTVETTFFIQAKIDQKNCADELFDMLRRYGITGSVFNARGNNALVASPHNDKNIRLVSSEVEPIRDKQRYNNTRCKFLDWPVQNPNKSPLYECRFLKIEINGKPYSVLYGLRLGFGSTSYITREPGLMQCQEGHVFNPATFFYCNRKDITITHLNPVHECSKHHLMFAITGPKK